LGYGNDSKIEGPLWKIIELIAEHIKIESVSEFKLNKKEEAVD
jgi:hypothetical protein